MNLQLMYSLQRTLDRRIEESHGLLKEDLFQKKLLALLVELGELANETRCFKFWSTKDASPREVLLEEFVDGIHFVLSLGIVKGFDQEMKEIPQQPEEVENSLTEQFLLLYDEIGKFGQSQSKSDYENVIRSFFKLGRMMNFSEEDIFNAYLAKNEVNHKRQDEGY